MENDLKERTPFNTKLSFLITILVLILMCLLVPAIERKPYTPRVDAALQAIELPPQLQQLREPPPPPKPKMPVAAESEEEVEAATMESSDFDGFEKQPTMDVEVYDFYKVEVKPKLLMKYCVDPVYPEFARKAGIEGTVLVEVIVDTTGYVIDAKVVKKLHQLLDTEAVKAVRKWRYTPARQRDRPVRVRVHQPVRFSLEGE